MLPTVGFNVYVTEKPAYIASGEIRAVTDSQLVIEKENGNGLIVVDRANVTVKVYDHSKITQHVGMNEDGSIGTVLHIPIGKDEDDYVDIGHQTDGTKDGMPERFCIVTSSVDGGLNAMDATPINLLNALAEAMGFKLVPLSQITTTE